MNKLSALLIALTLSLMVVSLNAVKPRYRHAVKGGNADEWYNAVCTHADRNNQNCGGDLMSGCLCFNNGTCHNTQTNRCSDCANTDVFSSLPGQKCPENQPYICQPPIPGKKYSCQQNKTESCVCTTNGTCGQRQASHCLDCFNTPNTLAVFENRQCPGAFLQDQPSKYFVPQICKKTDAHKISCLKQTDSGCVCYSNNTCEYRTDSNQCLLCFDKNVVSFNNGEYCPTFSGKLHLCASETSKKCKSTKNSCVCLDDGTCSEQQTNHCQGCKIQNAVDVIEGGTCPMSSYVSLSSSKKKSHNH